MPQKRVEFRPWDLPDKYDPDYKLFLSLPAPEFKLLPPLSTHLESLKPVYMSAYHFADLPPQAAEIYIEVRRTGKKRFSICTVKSPGGLILRRLSNHKTRSEAEQVFCKFMSV